MLSSGKEEKNIFIPKPSFKTSHSHKKLEHINKVTHTAFFITFINEEDDSHTFFSNEFQHTNLLSNLITASTLNKRAKTTVK